MVMCAVNMYLTFLYVINNGQKRFAILSMTESTPAQSLENSKPNNLYCSVTHEEDKMFTFRKIYPLRGMILGDLDPTFFRICSLVFFVHCMNFVDP